MSSSPPRSLKTETDSRDSHGGQARIKAARFPARKTLEEFDFAFQTSLRRDPVLHLGQLDFLHGRENVVLLGPPGTGKTLLSIALGIRACLAGHRVAFKTATEWVALLAPVLVSMSCVHGRLAVVRTIAAGEFKQRCLRLLDEVGASGEPIVITKRGRAVAQLAPVASGRHEDWRGALSGQGEITGDLVAPASDPGDWDALRE